jgi:putative hydrolase of the HAD superfamily
VSYRAVVFDLWETLVDWPFEASHELHQRIAARLGVPARHFTELWTRTAGRRANGALGDHLREICAELAVEGDGPQVESLTRMRRELTREALVPREGALETLAALRARGRLLGLISVCSEDVPELWDESPFAPHFDATVFSSAVGLRKPDPRIYRLACKRLGVEPGDCLYVGDGANDELGGARRAGMAAVLIESPARRDWDGPRIVSLSQVLTLI